MNVIRLRYSHIFFSLALCLMAACTSDAPDPAPDVPAPGAPMEFAVGEGSRSSRADGDTPAASAPAITEFAVYGDIISTDKSSSSSASLLKMMENMKVSYNTTSGLWEYTGTQYWYPNHEHSFVGISPVSALEPIDADPRHNPDPHYTNSGLSFIFTLPPDYTPDIHNDQVDILAATHRRIYTDGYGEDGSYIVDPDRTKVVMRFSHIMSQINIVVVLDDPLMDADGYLELHTLEMSDFDTQTEFIITPAPLQSNDRTDDRQIAVESMPDEKGSLTMDFSDQPITVENDGTPVSLFTFRGDNDEVYEDPLIMIPQEFGRDSEAKIVLSYTVHESGTAEKQIVVPLAGLTWEPGISYTYRLIVNRTGWHFGTSGIAPWEVTGTDSGDDINAEEYDSQAE